MIRLLTPDSHTVIWHSYDRKPCDYL